ncbi:MAG TPA: LLM class flavin-dependent oxidoreductase [Alphaproteobacteria bacterium]|nr:LLM class flavin-dependent oxidoreductase [Alphaproteobacteria bacterium]
MPSPQIGFLLPTRERIMEGRPEASGLMDLAVEAEKLGYDSVWVGDSLTARPRHEPLTLLAGVAARTARVTLGTAVLLPALRNPVLLAHQVATLDQVSEGRLVLGVGIAADVRNVRAEFASAGVPFEKRVGRLMEGLRLCRALWSGKPVTWESLWTLKDATIAPTPFRSGGPPIWIGGNAPAAVERVGRSFDGWFPISPDAALFASRWSEIKRVARDAGRDPAALTGAMYLTLSIDERKEKADSRLDAFLERYYSQPASVMRAGQAHYAGPIDGLAPWLKGYAEAGVSHFVLRFAGDTERQFRLLPQVRAVLGWEASERRTSGSITN